MELFRNVFETLTQCSGTVSVSRGITSEGFALERVVVFSSAQAVAS